MNTYIMYFTDSDNKIDSFKCQAETKQDAVENWLDEFDEDEFDLFSVELLENF